MLEPPASHGVSVVRGPFAFDHTTPSLDAGVRFYTPAIGDLLLDAWIEVDTAWNGLGDIGDIGTFSGGDTGLFGSTGKHFDMTTAAAAVADNAGLLVNNQPNLSLAQLSTGLAPVRFTAANPLKVVVSQDGQISAVSAFVLADAAPSSPLIVVTGVNDEFVFTGSLGAGTPETFTVAAGNYGTLNACIAAMAAATGSVSGEAFSTKVTPSNGGGGKILLTMVGNGGNGNTVTLGSHDVAAGLGFTANPDTFAGGVGGPTGASTGIARVYLVTCTPVSF